VIRFLAFLNGEAVGRIMGIIHHNWNETRMAAPTARFYQPEFIDDYKVVFPQHWFRLFRGGLMGKE
jgi:hypothetical protein